LQALYQIDARGEDPADAEAVALSVQDHPDLDAEEKRRVLEIARGAWAMRQQADAIASELAPAWPTKRQPMIDRCILRLAWYEMATGLTPAKPAVNEAIELAKRFSTEHSPAFINGLLDKMMRRLPERAVEPPASTGDPWLDDALTPDAGPEADPPVSSCPEDGRNSP